MTYDVTTQTETPTLYLDGTELKIGDEVIIARPPADPKNDALWCDMMVPCVARPGAVTDLPSSLSDHRDYGAPVVRVRVVLERGETQSWWFRLSELERGHTYEWHAARAERLASFKVKIRAQLDNHPFGDSSKGLVFRKTRRLSDKLYYAREFARNHKRGRDSARIIGKLTGHFHPTRPRTLSDDEVFVLLRKFFNDASWRAHSAILDRPTHPVYPAVRAYGDALTKLGGAWKHTPWLSGATSQPTDWFFDNEVARARIPHISTEKPQEVAYYRSVDKLLRGIETRTKPGRFLAKFFPNLTSDQVRQYANDYLVATAPKQLHFARTRDEIIMAINEGPGSCQSRHYYAGNRRWYRGHIHPAAAYASGDFEVLYITDDNKPGDPARLAAETQRITARVICNAKDKLAARIYGDHDKLEPLLADAGYEQRTEALVGCRLLRIYDENGSGSYIMPYVDAGVGSGGGCLYVVEEYDRDSGLTEWVLATDGEHSTHAGYGNKGLLDPEEEGERCTCERCDATHDSEDDIHYSDYEGTSYCSECEDDFVSAVTSRTRYGNDYDMVLQDNAIEIDGDWYADNPDLLAQCGFVQCIHCGEWVEIDDTTTTDSGMVCCEHQIVELAEESPDGNEYGYRPECTQYVNTETGDVVWLDYYTDVDDFTREDDEGSKYVPLDV